MVTCPKCGFVAGIGSDSCPKCGVIYAKVKQRPAATAPVTSAAHPAQPAASAEPPFTPLDIPLPDGTNLPVALFTRMAALPLQQEVAGESFCQEYLDRLGAALKTRGTNVFGVVLIPEPGNQYDSNAVKVHAMDSTAGFGHVGFIPREEAASVQRVVMGIFARINRWPCFMATLKGGTPGATSYGVVISIDKQAMTEVLGQ